LISRLPFRCPHDGFVVIFDFEFLIPNQILGLSVPSSTDLSPDGGFESGDAVRDVLDEGYVFELTHWTDGEQKTHLVTHFELADRR
jgi:hypothetical protein